MSVILPSYMYAGNFCCTCSIRRASSQRKLNCTLLYFESRLPVQMALKASKLLLRYELNKRLLVWFLSVSLLFRRVSIVQKIRYWPEVLHWKSEPVSFFFVLLHCPLQKCGCTTGNLTKSGGKRSRNCMNVFWRVNANFLARGPKKSDGPGPTSGGGPGPPKKWPSCRKEILLGIRSPLFTA